MNDFVNYWSNCTRNPCMLLKFRDAKKELSQMMDYLEEMGKKG